ncbi:hypothetical protein FCV43_07800 [Vibrio genomosp. F6]|uniref:DcaP family trimeric outer membrane transporter n=1 Tax=Vibrio genomosp. F6 TaxID=723172 RepID=UPI0010BD006C|nr:DcaP family trimeric outer membrane transporter [Vibrio genomosp. F6]TKF22140.1 hypothetical protein FCV43_07800 [Vibrio genomosp. F6]
MNTASFASETTYNFGGSIKAIMIHDNDVAGAGVNIPSNSLFGKSNHSDTKVDASLSQFRFGALKDFDNGISIDSKLVMDFNANNDGGMSPRLREAYLTYHTEAGDLLAGQTWSTFMDMRNYPLSLAEPTLSGVVFKRQPMLRWSQDIGLFRYDVALESGTNSDIQNPSGDTIDTNGALPDLVAGLELDNQHGWVRATAALSQIRLSSSEHEYTELGYGVQLSGGWNITPNNTVTLLLYTGQGTDRYLLGLSGTGATWNEGEQSLEVRETNSLMASYTRHWKQDLKSVFAYGSVESDALDWQDAQEQDTLTSSQYVMANLLWNVQPDLMVGVEYNYSTYERSVSDSRDNHRIMLGMEWKY